ncbi:general substrate transporter [Anaeromyces robustus]|uniref:General substrate transporter n=1 Tax=Anaeromyces robustus TaxID=1754192 RepID=A0A1Y1X707_9FUNG|nr:general substrate transporter [Anaeromyces robustus]|eukprot:ORX81176.1 general substrate transporter [Anaeromyces robustus]
MNSFQLLVCVTASFCGLLFGYEVGVMNVVNTMDAFNIYFGLNKWDGSSVNEYDWRSGMINSAFLLGSVLGALVATYFGEKYGRRNSIIVGACIFIIGIFLEAFSPANYLFISFGRIVAGIAIGLNSVIAPTYISEVAPAKYRGTLSSCYQLMTTFGIVIAAAINSIIWYKTNFKPEEQLDNMEWKLALLMQLIPGIGLAVLMFFLPKSPRWLCSKDRDEEAAEVLAKLNATSSSESLVQEELKAIQEDVAATRAAGSSSVSELFSSVVRRRTFITFLMQLFQQWTGINQIMYYQSQVYERMGFTKFTSTCVLPIINNLVNFVSTFPGMWGIEKLGRKTLLVIGAIMMAVFHLGVFICSTQTQKEQDNPAIKVANSWKIAAVICIFCFVFSFAWTWGPVPWVYQAEVFPLRVRVKGSAVGSLSNYFNNWILTFLGPYLMTHWKKYTFLLFAVCCFIAWAYSQFYVIESKGLNLEEMDAKMSGKA